MRRTLAAGGLALVMFGASTLPAAPPPPVVLSMDADRFSVSGEGNTVTGLRRAPVPYSSLIDLDVAVRMATPLPAGVRIVRSTPPQVIDYIWCVTEEGALVVGQQVRVLDQRSGQYLYSEGDIKRAYQALEANVPWRWIVDIPLGREVALTLEVRAMAHSWPVRAVIVTPSVTP